MTRRRSWLPENVTPYKDRHGKTRYRFRKTGFKTYHFKAEPGTEEFRVELAAARQCRADKISVGGLRVIPGSIDDVCVCYYASPAWKGLAPNTQTTYRGIIERFRERRKKSGKRCGELPVASITTAQLDEILGAMAATPSAANNLRAILKLLFRVAVKAGLRADNPAHETDSYRGGGSFHTWTEEEIAQYRAVHPLGTKARLALELLLNTAARRCNGAQLHRDQLINGKFHIQHVKGNDATIVECLPETRAAIDAMPVAGIGYFLVTSFGKPFSVAGFGNKMREWWLRMWHGRNFGAAGELGATACRAKEVLSRVTGHKKNRTFAYYAEKANREVLADQALANLKKKNLANEGDNG